MVKTPSEQLTVAIEIANTAHAGQIDRGGHPYILHCLWVMLRQKTIDRKICAVLHDVVEDTNVTLDELRERGLSERHIETIDLLTRRKHESVRRHIGRIIAACGTAAGQDAIAIKKDDILHNCDLSRLAIVTEGDRENAKRRAEYYSMLEAAQTCILK